jgi:hypothetical protein
MKEIFNEKNREKTNLIFGPIPELMELMELIPGAELVPGMCNIAE